MKKLNDEKRLPMDMQKRKRILILMEEAIRNAPVPFPKEEMTRLLREINRLKEISFNENVRELHQLLQIKERRKAGKISPPVRNPHPWAVMHGRRKGNRNK